MDREPIGTGRLPPLGGRRAPRGENPVGGPPARAGGPSETGRPPPLGGRRAPIFSSIGVDLPIPQKPTSPRRDGGRLGGRQFRCVTGYKRDSGGVCPPL